MIGRAAQDTTPPRLPGYGAFAREDVADARRRHPDTDLSGYATRRGLEMLGSRNAAGFFAALPLDEQLQYNVLRGPLPGGEQGILFHHVLPLPVDPTEASSTSERCTA